MGLERIIGEIAIGHSLREGVGHGVSHRRLEEVGGIEDLRQEGVEPSTGTQNGDGKEHQLGSDSTSSTFGCDFGQVPYSSAPRLISLSANKVTLTS